MAELGLKGPARRGTGRRAALLGAGLAAALMLGACVTETRNHGFVMPADGLEQVPVGSSRDQVLIVLGTPQTTATLDNEVFYYISQRSEQTLAFAKPRIVDQRVVAIYFDGDGLVRQVAEYGLQDGVIFDFVANTTPTGGADLSFIGQVLSGVAGQP